MRFTGIWWWICRLHPTKIPSACKYTGEALVAFEVIKNSLEPVFGLSILGYCRNMVVHHGRGPISSVAIKGKSFKLRKKQFLFSVDSTLMKTYITPFLPDSYIHPSKSYTLDLCSIFISEHNCVKGVVKHLKSPKNPHLPKCLVWFVAPVKAGWLTPLSFQLNAQHAILAARHLSVTTGKTKHRVWSQKNRGATIWNTLSQWIKLQIFYQFEDCWKHIYLLLRRGNVTYYSFNIFTSVIYRNPSITSPF